VTIPYNLAIINTDNTIAEIETEDIPIDSRVAKGKQLKREDIKDIKSIVALKYKMPYGGQIKF
jgi:DNA/RNA-binding domain of Phe-tRNA-synthetase-like protein